MRKTTLIIAFLAISLLSMAQPNIFPTPIGNVGIGTNTPTAKLDLNIGGYNNLEAGSRITIPLQKGANDPTKDIFIIRKEKSISINGGYPTIMQTLLTVKENGNTGIGIGTPNSKLHVNSGRIQISGNNSYGGPMLLFGGNSTNAPAGNWGIEYISGGEPGLNFWKPSGSANFGNYKMFLADNGKVSIGLDPNNPNNFPTATLEGDYQLFVAQGILTEKVKVVLRSSADWADYVFKPEYNLMPLSNVASFIAENGHLPNVPSAEEVMETGIDMAKMDAKLLEKIEELTLYIIELQRQVDELKK